MAGDETDTTAQDILREISSKLDKLDAIERDLGDMKLDLADIRVSTGKLHEMERDIREIKASSVMRDRKLEARVAKLETAVAKLRRKQA